MSGPTVSDEASNGYEAAAQAFMAARSPTIGVNMVCAWARHLPPGAAILDVGCGHGMPLGQALVASGYALFGIDAAPTLVAVAQRTLPAMRVMCEPVATSTFFDRRFDGVLAVGLVFLLPGAEQRAVLAKAAAALEPRGRILFTAPALACEWEDVITGGRCLSLGQETYTTILSGLGLTLVEMGVDSGGNTFYHACLP